jgi:hypothetical protein
MELALLYNGLEKIHGSGIGKKQHQEFDARD